MCAGLSAGRIAKVRPHREVRPRRPRLEPRGSGAWDRDVEMISMVGIEVRGEKLIEKHAGSHVARESIESTVVFSTIDVLAEVFFHRPGLAPLLKLVQVDRQAVGMVA